MSEQQARDAGGDDSARGAHLRFIDRASIPAQGVDAISYAFSAISVSSALTRRLHRLAASPVAPQGADSSNSVAVQVDASQAERPCAVDDCRAANSPAVGGM